MTTARRLLLVVVLIAAPGCSAFRAQAGVGFGLGADVQAFGLLHAGALFGNYAEVGPNYGRPPAPRTDYIVLGPVHIADAHRCFGVLPALFSSGPLADQLALEVGLALGPLSLRLGVNPATIGREPAAPVPAPDAGGGADGDLQVRFIDVYEGPTTPERVADTTFELPEGLGVASRSARGLVLVGWGLTPSVEAVTLDEGVTGRAHVEALGRAVVVDGSPGARGASTARLTQPVASLPGAAGEAWEATWSVTGQDGGERLLWVGGAFVGRRGLVVEAECPASIADEVLPRARRLLTSARFGAPPARERAGAVAQAGPKPSAPPATRPAEQGLRAQHTGPAARRRLGRGFSIELAAGWRLTAEDPARLDRLSATRPGSPYGFVIVVGEVARRGLTSAQLVRELSAAQIEAAGGPSKMRSGLFEEVRLPAGPGAHATLVGLAPDGEMLACWLGAVVADGRSLVVVAVDAHGSNVVEEVARRALATARLRAAPPPAPPSATRARTLAIEELSDPDASPERWDAFQVWVRGAPERQRRDLDRHPLTSEELSELIWLQDRLSQQAHLVREARRLGVPPRDWALARRVLELRDSAGVAGHVPPAADEVDWARQFEAAVRDRQTRPDLDDDDDDGD